MRPSVLPLLRLLAFLALALVLTWPMVTDPTHLLVGHGEASAGCHAWVLWYARNHLPTLVSPLLFHPHGADVMGLYGSDLLSPLLLSRLPWPPVALHNLWVVVLLVLGGWATDRLCRRLGAAPWGAFTGGILFETAPFFQHETLNGTTEVLAAAFLPLVAHQLLDLLDRPSLRGGLGAGLLAGLAVLGSAYNAFFLLVMGACLVLWRAAPHREWPGVRRLAAPLAAGGLAGATLVMPLVLLHLRHGARDLYARREDWTRPDLALPDAFADALAWFDPRDTAIPVVFQYPGGEVFQYWTTCTVYLGLVALALAAVGVWRSRARGPFLAVGVVAALIAMGPWLRVGQEVVQVGGWPVPMPSLALARLLPPFAITAVHAYRYAALVVLAVAVLASQAVRRPWWILPLLVDAVALSPVPRAVAPVPGSPVLEALAHAPEGAVLYVPFEAEDLGDLSRMLLAQTVHGRPIHDGGIHSRAGEASTALFRENEVVAGLSRRGGYQIPGPQASVLAFQELYDQGYRVVLCPPGQAEVEAWLSGTLGAPFGRDASWVGWVLSRPAGDVGPPP